MSCPLLSFAWPSKKFETKKFKDQKYQLHLRQCFLFLYILKDIFESKQFLSVYFISKLTTTSIVYN